MKRTRLGWLGPAIVIVGVAVAALGVWYMVTARPEPGDVIDTISIDASSKLVVRAEKTSDRNFVELVVGEKIVWRALVPPYGGRPGAPGIAWNKSVVSIRVIRGGRAEIFALAMRDAAKLGGFRLAPTHGAVIKQTTGPVTLTDHVRSYEIVSGAGWSELVAFDLGTGEAKWKQDLGAAPIERGSISGGVVWIGQGGKRRGFHGETGHESASFIDFQF